MPERKSGRRNDGEFRVSDGSGLYCRHDGPADVLGRGYYRGEALKSEQIPKKQASLRKKGIEKERFFVRNEGRKWEYVEVSEAEAMKQENVILWEEEEPGEWWAVYREDLII